MTPISVSTKPGAAHTHSTNLVALSLLADTDQQEILLPITPYYVMKVGHVPLILYRHPGAPEVVEMVGVHIPRCRAVMLQSLGPVVWDTSVSRAAFALEDLEETAKLHLITRGLSPRRLSEAEIADLVAALKIDYLRLLFGTCARCPRAKVGARCHAGASLIATGLLLLRNAGLQPTW